ncbi:PH domain-containing protein [Marinigracilibium pacificum]|uniref:PH domain-containing protein n=1 Tax=Marinigracilibium pacificum TaxID=2729599 RepID=A0A848J0V4_9BACT|nr:PH domain-containing protein [Marinigracilibium pacificum]NMM50413.1 PH domain-containing protein [Marinigracilibium pacificum]
MSIFDNLMGNASELSLNKIHAEFTPIMVEGEELKKAFKIIRDFFVFTNKRLILVNKQGITGKKREYLTIPYGSIIKFSKESAGLLDFDADLKIWIRGQSEPITKEFKDDGNINEVYRLLSQFTL